MSSSVNRAQIEFDSISDNLGFARVAAASFAAPLGFTVDELEDIKLAVSEAVSNCIVHAYPKAAESDGRIVMLLRAADGVFTVDVIDSGVGIADLEAARTPGYSCDEERLGMGFTLMEALAASLEVWSAPECGTRVRMAFSAGSAERR